MSWYSKLTRLLHPDWYHAELLTRRGSWLCEREVVLDPKWRDRVPSFFRGALEEVVFFEGVPFFFESDTLDPRPLFVNENTIEIERLS